MAQDKIIGNNTASTLTVDVKDGDAADNEWVANTWLNPRLDELKQLEELTSATSAGSAKVISTQLYKEAPCKATSTTCIVALSPTLTLAFTGKGTWGRQIVPG